MGITQEMLLSQQPSQDPEDATFSDSRFQLDYLTQPNGLSDMLITWGQPNVLERAQDNDEVRVDAASCAETWKGHVGMAAVLPNPCEMPLPTPAAYGYAMWTLAHQAADIDYRSVYPAALCHGLSVVQRQRDHSHRRPV